MKAVNNNSMLFMPLAFEYPKDERARGVEDQLLVGESIMIAPVYKANAKGRYVYLPEDMLMLKFKSAEVYTEEILSKGDHYIEVSPDEIPIFVKPGHELLMAASASSVAEIDYEHLKSFAFRAEAGSYKLYNDDGITR